MMTVMNRFTGNLNSSASLHALLLCSEVISVAIATTEFEFCALASGRVIAPSGQQGSAVPPHGRKAAYVLMAGTIASGTVVAVFSETAASIAHRWHNIPVASLGQLFAVFISFSHGTLSLTGFSSLESVVVTAAATPHEGIAASGLSVEVVGLEEPAAGSRGLRQQAVFGIYRSPA